MLWFIDAAPACRRNREQVGIIAVWDATQLIGRRSSSHANQSIKAVSGLARINRSIIEDRDGFCRIIERRIEIGYIICCSIGWLEIAIAHSEIQTQFGPDFPGVIDECLDLPKSKQS